MALPVRAILALADELEWDFEDRLRLRLGFSSSVATMREVAVDRSSEWYTLQTRTTGQDSTGQARSQVSTSSLRPTRISASFPL